MKTTRILITVITTLFALPAAFAQDGVVSGAFDRWHSSHAEAVRAAAKSQKPVLLFQLFGRLDRERC